MTVLRAATLGRAGLICGLVANVCTLSCSYCFATVSTYRDCAAFFFLKNFVVIACPQKFAKSTEPTDEFKA
jgi:hypothetical protein